MDSGQEGKKREKNHASSERAFVEQPTLSLFDYALDCSPYAAP
jgi:hypothetical protein